MANTKPAPILTCCFVKELQKNILNMEILKSNSHCQYFRTIDFINRSTNDFVINYHLGTFFKSQLWSINVLKTNRRISYKSHTYVCTNLYNLC